MLVAGSRAPPPDPETTGRDDVFSLMETFMQAFPDLSDEIHLLQQLGLAPAEFLEALAPS